MIASETLTVENDDVTLDLLLWRRYRHVPDGFVESVLSTNPGLADLGPVLPVGTVVVVELPQRPAHATASEISLWD
ncbi:MAG TPA: tail protein X [Xanthobacteraceae bacterium]|nr:tail protein X [Xanthobacteraceae bacterium]